jgi:Ca2+-binding RTX toxin-like protein
MGAGDDTFVWAPGDGNDTVEGQAGNDTLRFIGANAAENISIFANGGRAIFFRDVANVTMDNDDVETIRFEALGGVDNITVGDMTGTDVKTVALDLTNPNGVGGDGALDTVTVAGSNAADTIVVNTASDGLVSVTGLAARVDIEGADTSDRLVINALGGDDVVNASGLQGMSLTVNGGLGADVMIGSSGDDLFVGGDGNDTALMGAGDDTFVWNPGDDNDTIEGQAGNDTMLFNGANIAENINIFANGGRALFFRDVASVLMDTNDVEVFDFNALGGADNITVGDLSGTDVNRVNLDLAAAGGAADGAADTVNVQATAGDDFITLSMVDGALVVDGLSAQVVIEHFDPTLDTLRIFGLGGDDVIDASNLPMGSARLVLDGGLGNDVLLASADGSTLLGGEGDDILLGSIGNDVLDGGAGDNIVIGGGGTDTVSNALLQAQQVGQAGLLV